MRKEFIATLGMYFSHINKHVQCSKNVIQMLIANRAKVRYLCVALLSTCFNCFNVYQIKILIL